MSDGSRRFTRVRPPRCCSPTSVRTTSSRCSVDRCGGSRPGPSSIRTSSMRTVEIRERGYATSMEETDVAAWGSPRLFDRRTALRLPRWARRPLASLRHRDVPCFGQLLVDAGHRAERRLGSLLPATPLTNPPRATESWHDRRSRARDRRRSRYWPIDRRAAREPRNDRRRSVANGERTAVTEVHLRRRRLHRRQRGDGAGMRINLRGDPAAPWPC